jgi:hypothetical protein
MPLFDLVWNMVLNAGVDIPKAEDYVTNPVLAFVRSAPTADDRLRAWKLASKSCRAPVAKEALDANPTYGAFADKQARFLLSRLFLDPNDRRGPFTADPPAADVELNADFVEQVRLILTNSDKIRSFESRRPMVDILKKAQSLPALGALLQARTEIAAQVAKLSGPELLLTNDLLQRIDAATSPYFR